LLLVLYTNSEELPSFRPDPETIFATKNVDVGLDFARSDELAIDPTKPVAPVALFPPAVLVMTRPYHAGARATCAEPALSRRTMTSVCFLRKATSYPKLAAEAVLAVKSKADDNSRFRTGDVFMLQIL